MLPSQLDPVIRDKEEAAQLGFQDFWAPGFALPDHEHTKAHAGKLAPVPAVTLHVPVEFGLPVRQVAPRNVTVDAATMLMPEAPMDQHHCLMAPQDNIGFSWQSACVEPESQTHAMQSLPDSEFGLRILGPDPTHVLTACGPGERVHHEDSYVPARVSSGTSQRNC
jgi:hypothetical protein